MLIYFITGPFIYLAVMVFIFITVYKVLSYKKMPRHLRWDLYPVPHQGLKGSKYQIVDFYKKPHMFSKPHELIAIAQEMILIKKAFDHNRRLWIGSWPLHTGIYLSSLWLVLLVVSGTIGIKGEIMLIGSSLLTWAIANLTVIVGVMALVLGLFGSLTLLWLRLTNRDLRYIADFVTYFNLGLMAVLFSSGLFAWLTVDPFFDLIRQNVMALLTLRPSPAVEPAVVFEMLVFGVFLLYLPFSRMMHFAAKYFLYHHIMWDDEAMVPQSSLEQNIKKSFQFRPRWSSGHISSGKSWMENIAGWHEEGKRQHEETSSN